MNFINKSKLRKTLLIILFFSFLFQGCEPHNKGIPPASEKQQLINLVRERAIKRVMDECKLTPFGFGGEAMHEIKMLALAFRSEQKIDIEEGRVLLLEATQIFLEEINQEERIRPYLVKYPFDEKNIVISIFLDPTNNYDLRVIDIDEGILTFDVRDKKNDKLMTIHSESYQEALNIVRKNSIEQDADNSVN